LYFVCGRGITERIPSVVLNGDPEHRYVGNLNFSFAYVEGESLLMVRLHVEQLPFWSGENAAVVVR
jgi:cysteine sulfinate desulfinase/cysteine desulfurase-like protein